MTASDPIRAIPWTYVSGDSYEPAGISTQVPIPTNANIVIIAAEEVEVFYRINEPPAAGLAAPGYIAAGQREIIGPLDNWRSLYIYQIAPGVTHVQWFLQKKTTKSN